jgi:phage terminase Nu1 subunit (DNA packaging protein)
MELSQRISTADLAKVLGLAERTIAKLVDKKVLKREGYGTFDLADSVQAFVAYRESVVASEHGVGAYGKARAELYRERARIMRLKREELEQKLVSVADVIAFNTSVVRTVTAALLAVATKLAPRLLGVPTAAQIEAIIRNAISEVLDGLVRLGDVAAQAADASRPGRKAKA